MYKVLALILYGIERNKSLYTLIYRTKIIRNHIITDVQLKFDRRSLLYRR